MSDTVYFAIPGAIDTPTGGYGYDRKVMAELRRQGLRVEHLALPEGFPNPTAAALERVGELLASLPNGSITVIDGLAYGAMPEIVETAAKRLRLVALVHHPLADETGLPELERRRLEISEREALRHARTILCTSHTTARRLVDFYGVDEGKVTVALPGTERQPKAEGAGDPPAILCLAAFVRRKGHDVLLAALSSIQDVPWTCRLVGPIDRDPEWVTFLKAETKRLRLEQRVAFAGPTADPDGALQRADVFALPSRHEGYGMAFAEALAHGLPIVACNAGAVPEVVPPEAGLLVAPDDPAAFAAALRSVLVDSSVRKRLAAAAWAAGRNLPTWGDTARLVGHSLRAAR